MVYSYLSLSSSSARPSSSWLLGAVVPRVERRTGARFFMALEPFGRPGPLLSPTAGMIDRSLDFNHTMLRQFVGPTIVSNNEELWGMKERSTRDEGVDEAASQKLDETRTLFAACP